MTEVMDDRLLRDGIREKALDALGVEAEVRWLGPSQRAEVRIDVAELDRLMALAHSAATVDEQMEEAALAAWHNGEEEGREAGSAQAWSQVHREVAEIMAVDHPNGIALAEAIKEWMTTA